MSQGKSIETSRSVGLIAGSATVDITPTSSCFLHGYPGVPRYSTGVHDPLECNALWLETDGSALLMLANDVVYVGKALVTRVRQRISQQLPIRPDCICISATHTHSGPVMVELVSEFHDPVIPKPDPAYLQQIENAMVRAAELAFSRRTDAELAWATPTAPGIGTNRHEINGPSDLQVPTLAVRSRADQSLIALSIICTMHPTVLHEDSLLISGDFLGLARQQLRGNLSPTLPVLVNLGACGNQSPRHVTRANNFAEAERIGRCLSAPIEAAIKGLACWTSTVSIQVRSGSVELDVRELPDVATAEKVLAAAEANLEERKTDGSPRTLVRTAECDVFGARTTFHLAKTHAEGRLLPAVQESRNAQVTVLTVANHRIVVWPGEWFVEFQLELRGRHPDCFVMTMANGELQGYVVTEEAIRNRRYEAGNAVFDASSSAKRVLELTERLLRST